MNDEAVTQTTETNSTADANNDMNTQVAGTEKGQTNEERSSLASEAGSVATENSGASDSGAPDSYDFSKALPDGETLDEATSKDFGEICRGLNLTNEEANQVAGYGFQWAQRLIQNVADSREREIDSWATETKESLGANFDKTMNEYGAGLSYIEKTSPNIRQILNQTGAGNRVEVVKAIAELGRLVSEDKGVGGSAAGNSGGAALYPNTNFENY